MSTILKNAPGGGSSEHTSARVSSREVASLRQNPENVVAHIQSEGRSHKNRLLVFVLAAVLALAACACALTWAGANPASSTMVTEANDNGVAATNSRSNFDDGNGNGSGNGNGGTQNDDEVIVPLASNRSPQSDDVPKTVLEDLAQQGIYPGTMTTNGDGREVWTACDASGTSTANIKATVTLPESTYAEENSYLYIRKVNKGEGYYPTEDAIAKAAGEINGVQCYAIHWVKFNRKNDGTWGYELQTNSVLGEPDDAPRAVVKIEYLKDDARLKGHQAQRKLQVYNSRESDGSVLEENATPTDVSANSEAYTGFTFETNRGGPYVFVSKKLSEAYVKNLNIKNTTTGTAPFDRDDNAGNDSSKDNDRVRSFDLIEYGLEVTYSTRSIATTASSVSLHFEATMDADVTEAVFDTSKLNWLQEQYTIEYLDESGNVVLTQKPDGSLTDAQGNSVDLNELVSDSSHGQESYTTAIKSQRLTGTRAYQTDKNWSEQAETLSFGVQVLGATNDQKIKPQFKAWIEGNEDNYGTESVGESSQVQLAQKVTDNTCASNEITVSAGARFNMELTKNNNMSYKGWFDFSTGKEVSESNNDSYTVGNTTVTGKQLYALLEQLANLEENRGKANPEDFTDSNNTCGAVLSELRVSLADLRSTFENIRYGRITGYGATLQVYNDASQEEGTGSKGFKGVSLPQGDISLDLALATSVSGIDQDKVDENQYYSQLWEYNENVTESSGNQGHNMHWANLATTQHAAWAAPFNSGEGNSACYNGGTWSLGSDGHFTVSGYDFDFSLAGLSYPTHKAGNSDATTGYNSYIGCFSAGYIQVLTVMPRCQAGTVDLSTNVTVKNLAAETTGGQQVSAEPGDATGYAHETNTGDNVVPDTIPLYAKGGMTKANAFCDAATFDNESSNFTSKDCFLGTDFWGTSYDCSAFAGQRVTLVGAARINAGDYRIRHMNMLQLFDSEVLSPTQGKTPYVVSNVAGANMGDTTILYAADPDYKNGYDTSDKAVMEYMSTVREEDLIYFRSLDDLTQAGYTCVGVLAELRNCDISGESGYGTALKIAMDVSDSEAHVGKTVGTVNTVRMWTNVNDMGSGTVSWADGTYDPNEKKNSVEGYTPVNPSDDEHYSGEVSNGEPYEKTEYENGRVVLGSNTGGYVYGSSLLILGYKSEVDIDVDREGTASTPTYDMDAGDNTVHYHLGGIIARSGNVGTPQNKTTNLTVLSKLDTDPKQGQEDQRMAVSDGSYAMVPASSLMQLVDENGVPLDTQSVAIGSDPSNPTVVRYQLRDSESSSWGATYEIKVYAQRDTNGTQVAFQISGVTLDTSVPDITYDALIDPQAVSNNDTIQASAYISGTDDVRAYETTNGNKDDVGITIVKLHGTRLAKQVDEDYIELNGLINYTVAYANSGANPVNVYLYDLLPNTNDIRGSKFSGEAILRQVGATMEGGDASSDGATIELYYSKTDYAELYAQVSKFGARDEGEKSAEAIQTMLHDTDYFRSLGTITGNGQLETSDYLKKLCNDGNGGVSAEKLTKEMSQVTGIYAVIEGMQSNVSLQLKITVETQDNEAANLYRNIANSWVDGDTDALTSNRVETSVLARALNGVVWSDENLNGVRDSNEELVRDVTCTLFKWDEGAQKYVPCEEDITGEEIEPLTTGTDGAYSFEKLAEGKYVVAFSGGALNEYKGATTYRVGSNKDEAATNDAVALSETPSALDTEAQTLTGIDESYAYAIAYDLTPHDEGDARTYEIGSTDLHSIEEIVGGNITLTNSVELYANLDCGLVKNAGFELPETGGAGTAPLHVLGAALLVAGTAGLGWTRRHRRRQEAA